MHEEAKRCYTADKVVSPLQGFLAALYEDESSQHVQLDTSRWAERQGSALEKLRSELMRRGSSAAPVASVGTATDTSHTTSSVPMVTTVKAGSTTALDSGDAASTASSLADLTQIDTNNDNATTILTVRPNISGISRASPDKNEDASSLLFLCSALAGVAHGEADLDATARHTQQDKTVTVATAGGDHTPHTVWARSETMDISAAVFATQRALHRRQLRAELEATEMAECTFQPNLAPGTRAMLLQRRRQQEQSASCTTDTSASAAEHATMQTAADEAQTASPRRRAQTVARQHDTAYTRLFSAAAQPKETRTLAQSVPDAEAATASRRALREEQEVMRRYCHALHHTPQDDRVSDMDVFLSNVLPRDAQRGRHTLRVETTYRSPMAIAFAREARRTARQSCKPHSGRAVPTHSDTAATPARGRDFDAFLRRQAELRTRKACTVQQLEQELTPAFKPTTTRRSGTLVARMIERSVLERSHTDDDGAGEDSHVQANAPGDGVTRGMTNPELSTILTVKKDCSISLLSARAAMVKKHKSPYVDPCTFQPRIAPATRAHYAEKSPISARTRYEVLYDDHARRLRAREAARRRAAEATVEGLTFTPALNTRRNATVQSLLQPENEEHYMHYLQARRAAAKAAREAQRTEAAKAEERECTFAPRTAKLPSYITSMATSFGVVRRHDVEF